MPRRILHLSTARTWRGGEQQIQYLVRGLTDLGCENRTISCRDSALSKRFQKEGLDVVDVSMRGELDFWAARRIRQVIREYKPDLVHAHTARAHSLALLALRTENLPLFVSRRVDFPARTNWLSRRKYASPLVTAYIAISENVKKILIQDGLDPARIRIAYSGIDPDRFAVLPDPAPVVSRYTLAGKVVMGNVAALVDHKDQRTLLRALALLGDAPDWACLIVGSGELEEPLKKLAYQELGLDPARVIFTGFLSDVLSVYASLNIFVMSSKEEGLGTSVLDAMACGLPVVATRGGGIPEMVDHGQGGLLVGVGDPEALASSLRQVLSDPAFRERAGAYNKMRVQKFHFRETARQTLNIYNEFAGGRSAS